MKIVVVGGGKVGYYLIKTLYNKKHEISLVEKNSDICDKIAEELDILVINGDGTNVDDLKDAGTGQADTIIAVTGKDEENLVICQIAKKNFDVPRTIARVNNPKNEKILKILGVDTVVCSTSIIANLIEKEVLIGEVKTLLTFNHGEMTIVETNIQKTSPVINKMIKDIELPADCIIVSVIRGDKALVPKGDTVIKAGDVVISMVNERSMQDVKDVMIGNN
ncbi:NAD-binding protein [Thermoanaerobacterium sp. RBIITD]|uniref:potassium channel family protein n=1 Tax=Thermoanaerobacterium sp. RBIITD TaxID=1550240 RepID=UPI000BB85828|nr:NAD-binding protein [Thermoanaerobacterium sp. RBIITD]SNX52953.1 trk system potassium uptake protein TrkA [Thermoanaerobacterium sp. RBIITD]